MAGNTRGKIKEKLESIHRNLEWGTQHCADILGLIGDKKPDLSEAISGLGQHLEELDGMIAGLYGKI